MLLPSIKNNRFAEHKLLCLQILLILTMFGVIFYLGVFLYRDFYETIIQAQAVQVLRNEVSLKDVDMDKYLFAQTVEKQKHTNVLPNNLPDIFAPFAGQSASEQ